MSTIPEGQYPKEPRGLTFSHGRHMVFEVDPHHLGLDDNDHLARSINVSARRTPETTNLDNGNVKYF